MKHARVRQGRIFVIRLEDGEILHEEIERFAREHSIRSAALLVVGGADRGSRLVVGPKEGRSMPVSPMERVLENVHEVAGAGTLFPDEEGRPVLHVHAACGRGGATTTGCVRSGVKVWRVMEVVLFELLGFTGERVLDPETGFKLLEPETGESPPSPR